MTILIEFLVAAVALAVAIAIFAALLIPWKQYCKWRGKTDD